MWTSGALDLFGPPSGTQDVNGDLPSKANLRAPDERKKSSSTDGVLRESQQSQTSKKEADSSSNATEKNAEVQSQLKSRNSASKRKGGPQNQKQVYCRVEVPHLTDGSGVDQNDGNQSKENPDGEHDDLNDGGMGQKKKKPTPTNSENLAEAAGQPCLSQ